MSVHPTLEAVARAICEHTTAYSDNWRDYLPEARAALNALCDWKGDGGSYTVKRLREIAAEPVTVEELLGKHRMAYSVVESVYRCGPDCDWRSPSPIDHPAHVADTLRAAGLVNEP